MIKNLFYTFMTFVVVHETRMHVERELWMSKSQGPVGVPILNLNFESKLSRFKLRI